MARTVVDSKVSRAANLILIGVFGALLWLPTVEQFLHLDHSTAFDEKRRPAPFPGITPSVAGVGDYTRGLEAWFNDHFGWRKLLIHWHMLYEIRVLRTKVNESVILGKDGWLFYSPKAITPEDHADETTRFSQQELADYQRLLERRRDWLAQCGIRYVFLVAPDKQSIYPEFMPASLKPPAGPTKLDQFLAQMRAHSSVIIPDVRPALREARRIAPTYYKTDSHWNSFGGFIASEELVKALTQEVTWIHPVNLSSFDIKEVPGPGGDLAGMLGVPQIDENPMPVPKPKLPAPRETVQNPEFAHSTLIAECPGATGSALVFRDSFGTGMWPFLGFSFKKVVFVWSARDFDAQTVQEIKPDVVISEVSERKFAVLNVSKKLRALEEELANSPPVH